jgi:hypothetical protein
MIIYVATYPRSGNFWIRSKIKENFGIMSTEIYLNNSLKKQRGIRTRKIIREQKANENWQKWVPRNGKFIRENLMGWEYDKKLIETKTPIKFWLHRENNYSEEFTLVRGLKDILKYPAIRAYLSDQECLYVIKTHEYPFSSYHTREKVLQIVRNPGAAYWSYNKFLQDVQNFNVNLKDMIKGKIGFGSWKIYHDKYIQAEQQLGNNYLRILFEDFKLNELETIKSLAPFLERPLINEDIIPFDHYKKQRPQLARKGTAFGWEENYTREDLTLLWDTHKDTMAFFGYEKPDFSLSKNE